MATAMTDLPLDSPLSAFQTEIANKTTTSGPSIPSINYYQRVMSGYFETMSIPILLGRGFQTTDAASEGRIAIVNETLANTYWRGLNPIGQRLRPCCGGDANSWVTVIGVAQDVKQGGVDQPAGYAGHVLLGPLGPRPPPTLV